MYNLDYIILQHFNTHCYKLSEDIHFYKVIFNRFRLIIYFQSGWVKI